MEKKDMLMALIQHFTAGNKAKFAKKLGVTPQTVSTWLVRNTFDADRIFAKCEGVNGDWLLSGNGDMIVSVVPKKDNGLFFEVDDSVHVNLLDSQCKQIESLMRQNEALTKSLEIMARQLEAALSNRKE